MPNPIPLLLLTGITSAQQITTTFWAQKFPLGTNHIGYVGSIIAANNDKTTVALTFDNGTDTSALNLDGQSSQTVTIGPTIWGAQAELHIASATSDLYKVYCEKGRAGDTSSNLT
ncbi:hypothetical protein BDW02DRAFT_26224 [Decorospora gaudefroyi]|uniref:Uncharacterized protein n=1 Tax=Decorospora gaudefroyi TaxID=184978 RepID=A0A6A5KEW5_9PLEO|nr:hypothetical protein BDW02DRAFT_26224 [Decorospora gaudefroyi]